MNKKTIKRVFRGVAIVALFLLMSANMTACMKKDKHSVQADENNLFVHGLVAVMNDDEKWGYINEQGEMAIEPQFDQAHGFMPNGLAAVGKGVDCGYINTKGEVAIEMKYDDAEDFTPNGLAVVRLKGKYGVIDEKGNVVVDCQYDAIEDYMHIGVAPVRADYKWGLINEKGELVVEPKYAYMNSCGEGDLIAVGNDDGNLWGYIDAKGNEVIAPSFWAAYPFSKNGLAAVKLIKERKKGSVKTSFAYIDKTGKVVVDLDGIDVENPNPFSDGGLSFVFPFASNGLARVGIQDSCTSQKFGYVNEKGELVYDVKFSFATDFDENGLAIVSEDNSSKIIDSEGNVVFDDNCRRLTEFIDGYAWAIKSKTSVKIDTKGNKYTTVEGNVVDQFSDGYAVLTRGEDFYIINGEGEQIGDGFKEIYRTAWGENGDSESLYLDGYRG